MSKKIIIGVVVVIVIAVIGFLLFGSRNNSDDSNMDDLVDNAAMVNGVAISKSFFEAQVETAVASFKGQGIDVENPDNLLQIKNQVLTDLINNELLVQAVKEAGIEVSAEDIDKEVQIVKDQAGSQEIYEQQLAAANLTEAQLKENISNQLAVRVYLIQNVDISSVTITDDEVQKFYDDIKATQPELPSLDEIEDQVREQLIATKQQALINAFLVTLREEAEVTVAPVE